MPRVVLIGAGHTHLQVLRSWARDPPAASLTVIIDNPISVYSGMVPGLVGDEYTVEQLSIDVLALAAKAGARVISSAARLIEPTPQRVLVEAGEPISYDLASLDVGSTSQGLDLPGVAEHAVATRPIGTLSQRIAARFARSTSAPGPLRIAIVGGGAAGVELSFAVAARARASGRPVDAVLIHREPRALNDYAPRVSAAIEREARQAGIVLRHGEVRVVDAAGVTLGTGEHLDAELVVWAAGAAPPGLLLRSELPRDAKGFVCVEATLQVKGHPQLFAVGDCATLEAFPWVSRAGVFAVREGPILDANLRAALNGTPLKAYHPQHSFLTLLNLGGGRALGTRNGIVVAGRWVRRWKDSIDRKFVERFRAS